MVKILHLEDDKIMVTKTGNSLRTHNFGMEIEYIGTEKEDVFYQEYYIHKDIDCVLLDISIGKEMNAGIRVLKDLRTNGYKGPIIMFSSIADPKIIAHCLKYGANDYSSKDLGPVELAYRITKCIRENVNNIEETNQKNGIFYAGKTLRAIQYMAHKVIKSPVKSVLVNGESGTGKELVAQIIKNSLPNMVPFVTVNCGTLTENIMYAELFGHEKGAFTGASSHKIGLLQAADNGWIFLDEVARLPYDAQVALLRTLESGEIRPVGSNRPKKVNIRVIAATNENLEELVKENRFRADLYQRLKTYPIRIPPLRERNQEEKIEIIDFLVYRLNKQANQIAHQNPLVYRLASEVRNLFLDYDWKEGNIREMWNTIMAASVNAIDCKDEMVIGAISLPGDFLRNLDIFNKKQKIINFSESLTLTNNNLMKNRSKIGDKNNKNSSMPSGNTTESNYISPNFLEDNEESKEVDRAISDFRNSKADFKTTIRNFERTLIKISLSKHKSFSDVFKELGMSRSTLDRKRKELGITDD